MKRVLLATVGTICLLGSLAGCSSDGEGDTEDPVPVGGINGPARVDPDSGGAENNSDD